jgi:predicted ABC-type ATPase
MDAKSLLNNLKQNPRFGEISYDEIIFDALKSSSTMYESAEPSVLILCGPPGSGKSTIKTQLLVSKNISDYVNIDPDEIRSILMGQGLTFPDDKTMSGITNAFNKRISNEVQNKRFNIVFDTTGQNFRAVFDLIRNSRDSGYKTHFVIVYASLETCLARVNSRNARLAETASDRIPLPIEIAKSIYKGFLQDKGTASLFLLDYPVRADEILLYDNNSDGVEPKLLYQKVQNDVIVSSDFPNFYNMTLRETAPYIVKKRSGGKTKRIRRKKSRKTRRRHKKLK